MKKKVVRLITKSAFDDFFHKRFFNLKNIYFPSSYIHNDVFSRPLEYTLTKAHDLKNLCGYFQILFASKYYVEITNNVEFSERMFTYKSKCNEFTLNQDMFLTNI